MKILFLRRKLFSNRTSRIDQQAFLKKSYACSSIFLEVKLSVGRTSFFVEK
jgi:hypothetical protein